MAKMQGVSRFTVDPPDEQVREVVVRVTHYVGWPISTGISGRSETIVPRRAATAADAFKG
jgi:hypothetical protein